MMASGAGPGEVVAGAATGASSCTVPQPPDGAVIGCGQEHDALTVCHPWMNLGVATVAQLNDYIQSVLHAEPPVCEAVMEDVDNVAPVPVLMPDPRRPVAEAAPIETDSAPQPDNVDHNAAPDVQVVQAQRVYPATYLAPPPDQNVDVARLQFYQQTASILAPSTLQAASMSVASMVVSDPNLLDSVRSSAVACRAPQPPDGRWLGCGQAEHYPVCCLAWAQQGLTHADQIQPYLKQVNAGLASTAALSGNRLCSMRQPPVAGQTGALRKGCGQAAHPDQVCASWLAQGVFTLLEARQKLLEWKKQTPAQTVKSEPRVRKRPDRDRCIVPQPPDGAVRGCSSSGHHRGEVCDAWKGRGITTFPEIREFLMNWHKDHPDSNRKPCTFVQPPDGVLRGCGAPHHKGRVCGSWAEHGILSRQDALNKLREDKGDTKVKLFKSRSDAEKLCNLPQPPDGRVIGCGEPFHRMNVCDSWVAFGVPNREGVKTYVDKYRSDHGITGTLARVCRALQPPDGRIKGCGLGWHRGACPTWKALGLNDRKSMQEYIRSFISKSDGPSDGDRLIGPQTRSSHLGISRVSKFPEFSQDRDSSVRLFLEGDFDRSVHELTKRIRKDPDNAKLYNNRGVVYAERGWPDLALRDWAKAVLLDPSLADAYANRALGRVGVCKPVLASDDCKSAMALLRDDPDEDVLMTLAMALYETGDFDGCLAECTKVLDISSDSVQARTLTGLAYGAKKQYVDAAEMFEAALELSPDNARLSQLLGLARKKLDPNAAPSGDADQPGRAPSASGSVVGSDQETLSDFDQSDLDDDAMPLDDDDEFDRQSNAAEDDDTLSDEVTDDDG
ncbi:Tetratricopeptide repeat [Plasmodiophora brassicae]|uniref:Uncharacterized protein n=1 Tax=Plasmodiophora brassicae TaxID=37360 RepID=A0A3P3Y4Z1_PLABS|nr:unnamed protein product [Plasmodiophora brassicae]